MSYSIIVIGAGISGASAVRMLAENGMYVFVVDKHSHVAECANDYADEHEVMIHKYELYLFCIRYKN